MAKKAIFIDRDGTIIVEPPITEQIDSLEVLEFVAGAISGLKRLSELDFELVLATNQDGLGSSSFPQESFDVPHRKMLTTLRGEGVEFADQLIDNSRPEEQSPRRKPQTGMFGRYTSGDYDLSECWVIGDRATDVELAKNLGARAILLSPKERGERLLREAGLEAYCDAVVENWSDVTELIRRGQRRAEVTRKTRETEIAVTIDLDNECESRISTGLNFFDHMLDQIPHHAHIALCVDAKGDLQVDEHHTIEDVAIVLGQTLLKALGDKVGIERYGFALPMDECEAMVLLDFSGRIDFDWRVSFEREYVGDVPTEMFRHFFGTLAAEMRCNLHIEAAGVNEHHKIEAVFKAFARALRAAIRREPFNYTLPSSKALL